MAEPRESIFNERAAKKLRSPDDLDKYVRVTNPSIWVILAACVLLLAGLLAWGVFGAVTTNMSATGTVVNGKALCFLTAEEVAHVKECDPAMVDKERMVVSSVSKKPVSYDGALDLIHDDYLAVTLITDNWEYVVEFEGNTSKLDTNVPLTVNITTERVAPISLILGS